MENAPALIPDLVEEGFAKNTTGIVSSTKRHGRWIATSIADFRRQVEAAAFGFYTLGVRRGDRVALHAENSTEWLIVDQAVLRLGAVTVPIYTTQPGDQIRFILENAEARIYVVSTPSLFEALRPFVDDIASLETTVGLFGTYHEDMLSFEAVQERGRRHQADVPNLLSQLRTEIAPDDVATLIYTSGTTGLPKGVMLTHRNLVSNIGASLDRAPFDVDVHRGHTVLSYLPLAHSFERMISLLYLSIGFPIYFIERHEEILEDLQTVRPIHFTTVPRLLEKVYAGIQARAESLSGGKRVLMSWALRLAGRFEVGTPVGLLDRGRYALADRLVYGTIRRIFGGNLVALTSGGAALAAQIMNFFNAIGIYCGQGYGLTETSPVVTACSRGVVRAGSVGKPVRGVEVTIAEDREILTRGPHVMKGYYKLPEATRAAITDDGWFYTGDIGHFDDDGFLYITDRKKQLLKLSTGKYIAPQPIELALAVSAFIEQVVVIGNDCKFCSALIVLDTAAVRRQGSFPETDLATHEQVIGLIQRAVDTVNASLPHWEQVKQFRLLEQPFSIEGGELTPTLKVKRRVVQEKYEAVIASMYS